MATFLSSPDAYGIVAADPRLVADSRRRARACFWRMVSKRLKNTVFQLRRKDASMNITLSLAPLISVIAGILILIIPRLLNYIVALYLIVIGLIGLFGAGNFHF